MDIISHWPVVPRRGALCRAAGPCAPASKLAWRGQQVGMVPSIGLESRFQRPTVTEPKSETAEATMHSLRGNLLVASPHLPDPNFFRSVVFIVEHQEDGALGLILNRVSPQRLKEVWETASEAPCVSDQYLRIGGPVPGPLMAPAWAPGTGRARDRAARFLLVGTPGPGSVGRSVRAPVPDVQRLRGLGRRPIGGRDEGWGLARRPRHGSTDL